MNEEAGAAVEDKIKQNTNHILDLIRARRTPKDDGLIAGTTNLEPLDLTEKRNI